MEKKWAILSGKPSGKREKLAKNWQVWRFTHEIWYE